MKDSKGREINHLRISITDRCNLNCEYCHREGSLEQGELTLDKIHEIAKSCKELGIEEVKITGGEPLVHKDCIPMVKTFKDQGLYVSMLTNGILFPEKARSLSEAGLDQINIGCDSLLGKTKSMISIEKAVEAAKANKIKIKINLLVMKSNVDDLPYFMEFASQHNAILQVVELVELYNDQEPYSLEEIENNLAKAATEIKKRKMQGRRQYSLPGLKVEVVRPKSESFCRNCNKIRITSSGRIKTCLMKDAEFKLEGTESIKEAIQAKC